MKTSAIIVIVLSVLSLSASFELSTGSGKMYPLIRSGQKGLAFIEPPLIYKGNIKGQTVMIDYSSVVAPTATKVEFMMFIDVGDAQISGVLVINHVKVQNAKEFHFNAIAGRTQSTYWSSFSESFTFPTDGTNKVTLSIAKSFGGIHHAVYLYVTGYYL